MKEHKKLIISRRHLLQWSVPIVTAVTLPLHATASEDVPSFSIKKEQTGGPNPVANEGDVIEYTITITNDGEVDLTGVTVTDSMPDGSTGTLSDVSESISTDGVLQVGEVWQYQASYTVTLEDLVDGSNLVNTVTVQTNELSDLLNDIVETPVVSSCSCEGPPVLTVITPPKCSGTPPSGTALIEISAPGECDMEIKSLEFTTDDDKSTLSSLPDFPIILTSGSTDTFTWTGPGSDGDTCLPLAQISATIEYCCEDEILLTEVYDITQLLVDSQ